MSGLTPEERARLAMAVSTGCGCAPDGLCESCQIAYGPTAAAVERIVADRERAAEVRALRDAADNIAARADELRARAEQRNAQGMPTAATVDRIQASREDETADWLRDRADRIEGGDQ